MAASEVARIASPVAPVAVDWATAVAAATGPSGEAPSGVIGGGTASASSSAVSAAEYAEPAPELVGQNWP